MKIHYVDNEIRSDESIGRLLAGRVFAAPDNIALICEDRELTYQELDARADQIADCLISSGVKSESAVGVFLGRSLEAVITFIGILKAGAVFLPLDITYPISRLEYMIADSKVSFVVTNGRPCLLPAFPKISQIDLSASARGPINLPVVTPAALPDSAAYVVYTSGSAGEPKGVVGTHKFVTRRVVGVNFDDDAVSCHCMSFSFGYGLSSLFTCLLSGIPIAITSDIKDLQTLATTIKKSETTDLFVITSTLEQIVRFNHILGDPLRKVRSIVVGGEPFPTGLLRQFRLVAPHTELFHQYGASEMGPAAFHQLTGSTSSDPAPIGRPFPNMKAYILDHALNPVPSGMVGELYVGSQYLARGYINKPTLTAERFVPDPFALEAGSRMYRTGDLAKMKPDGLLEYIGRADRIINLRGFRIDVGEIESVLGHCPGVQRAIVIPRENARGDIKLVGYILASDVYETCDCWLRLERTLPSHLIPSALVRIEKWPALPNGKLDLQRLPAPTRECFRSQADYLAPATVMEASLVSIWKDVLNLGAVALDDNFFELGGTSLLLLHVWQAIGNKLNLSIPVSDLFKYPTVRTLAARALR